MWLSEHGIRFRAISLLLAGILLLGGCGFQPLYGTGKAATEVRGDISIDVVRGHNAFELRERLEERLGASGPGSRYALGFTLRITSSGLGVSDAAEITRYNLTGIAEYTVRDLTTGTVAFKDRVKSFTAYSATSETYPTRIAERDANVRMARSLADLMATRIATTAQDWMR
jgi:LPS-assembly lipoprotein